jgi:hypothetical protein
MATPVITPREQAILTELRQFGAGQPINEPRVATSEAMSGTAVPQPQDRNQAILQELQQLGAVLPQSRNEAVLRELGHIARRNQDIISGTSFLEKTFDVLNTPQQFLFGLLTKEANEDLIQAGIRGTRENARFADVLERDFSANPDSWGTKIAGFAGDLLFDPLLFLPVGKVIKVGGKVIGGVGKFGFGAAEHVAPNLTARLYESAVKPLARAFSKTALRSDAEKELISLIDLELTKAQARANRILLQENEARQVATDIAKRLNLPEQDVFNEVARRVEVKTQSQLAFPFATEAESKRVMQSPQLDLFPGLKGEVGREFALIESQVKDAAADLASKLPAAEEREIAQQATSLKQRLENALVREQSFGLSTTRLEDATVDYLTHLTTPEAKKLIAELPEFRSLGREFDARHAFQLARQLDESHPTIRAVIEAGGSADIATLNRLWQEGKLFPDLGPQTSKLFVDDPYAVAAVRRIRGEKAIADAEILIKTAGNPNLALPKAAAPSNFRPLRLPSDARWDRLRGYLDRFAFDPDVAAHLEQTIQTTLLPEGLDKFLKGFDTVQNLWKQLTLHIFPSYHTRNFVGNVWNNWLAGLDNPKWYFDAAKVQLGTARELTLAGKTYSLDALRRMAEDFGISTGTFAEAETFRKSLPGMSRVYFEARDIPGLGKAVGAGQKLGQTIEENSRLALFLHELDNGKSATEAALTVKKYLFDYTNGLTRFEQSVMRRVMPFYTWTRFNLPLQVRALVDNPRPYLRLSEFVNTVRTKGIAGGKDFEERAAAYRGEDAAYLAEFIKQNAGIPVRTGPNGEPEFYLLSSWIPAADLDVLGSKGGMFDRLKDLLSPFIKTPIEQLSNRDLFKGRELEQYPGETQRFLNVEVRRRYAQLLRNVRLLAEADRVLKAWNEQDQLEPDQQSKLSALTRLLFGLKGYEARPEVEGRRLQQKQRERMRRLRGAIRNDLPDAAQILAEQLDEDGQE